MNEEKLAVRRVFGFYGWLCLGAGLVLLGILGLLRATNWLINWKTPFDPADLMIFGAGLIVVVVSLGPYVATVGQLAGVAKIKATLRGSQPTNPRRRQIMFGLLIVVGLVFAGLLVWSRSFITWLTFGSLLTLMGLAALYVAWKIGQIEQAANITIYQTDFTWRFDKTSYIGIFKTGVRR